MARVRAEVASLRLKVDSDPEREDFLDAMEVKLHFRIAGLLLSPVQLWDIKNDDVSAYDRLKSECTRALAECDRGLDLIRETNTEQSDYFLYRSFLRTLRGRALALRGRFIAAFRDFDRALAGLDPRIGADRSAMSIRTLAHAESLMFYADSKIIAHCTASVTARPDASWLAPQGRLLLGYDAFVSALDPEFSDHNALKSARQLLRRAMTPWADHLPKAPKAFLSHVQEGLRVIAVVDPTSATDLARAQTALGTDPARIAGAWNQIPEPDYAAIREALRRSLAYWDATRLEHAMNAPGTWEAYRTASRTLERAGKSLVEAETLLAGARRDNQFSFLLHRFRAGLLRGPAHSPDRRPVLPLRRRPGRQGKSAGRAPTIPRPVRRPGVQGSASPSRCPRQFAGPP